MINITGETRLTGLIGRPIKQSFSPRIHNRAFEYLDLNYLYIPFDVDENNLKKTVEAMKTLNFAGFNITMPYKEAVMELLDGISQEAKIIGAVNTVVNEKGEFIGYNTDGKGYVQSLENEGVLIKDKTFVIVGAGGAARSVIVQLALEGAKQIILLNRTIKAGQNLVDIITNHLPNLNIEVGELGDENLERAVKKADVLVNSTPLGMYSMRDETIVKNEEILASNLVVSDLIYNPAKTKLLHQAQNRKCKTINGLGMLVGQAAIAFELWTGLPMPTDYIMKTVF